MWREKKGIVMSALLYIENQSFRKLLMRNAAMKRIYLERDVLDILSSFKK